MIIRKTTKKELPIILKLYTGYQKEEEKLAETMVGRQRLDKEIITKDLQDFLLKKDKILLVAIEEGKIMGFLAGSFIKDQNQKISKIGSIDEIYVIPMNRGHGISSKLSSKLKDEFIEWFNNKKGGEEQFLFILCLRIKTPKGHMKNGDLEFLI